MSEDIWKEVIRGVFSVTAALIGAAGLIWSAYINHPNAAPRFPDKPPNLEKPPRSEKPPFRITFPSFRVSFPPFRIPFPSFNEDDRRSVRSITALAAVIVLGVLLLRPGSLFRKARIDPEYFDASFRWKRHTYALSNRVLTWEDAREYCEKVRGHLATITTEEEQEKIKEIVEEAGHIRAYWLGGFQSSDGWQWVTQEPFDKYENWDRGEPNGSGACMQLYANGHTWDDTPSGSSASHGFICEWEY